MPLRASCAIGGGSSSTAGADKSTRVRVQRCALRGTKRGETELVPLSDVSRLELRRGEVVEEWAGDAQLACLPSQLSWITRWLTLLPSRHSAPEATRRLITARCGWVQGSQMWVFLLASNCNIADLDQPRNRAHKQW